MSCLGRFGAALAVVAMVAGCGGDDSRPGIDFGTDTTGGTGGSSTTGMESTGTMTEGSGSTSEGTTTDDPSTTDPTGGSSGGDTDDSTTTDLAPVPCIGVDILFVVDNSTGMAAKQTRLTGTAQAFVDMVRDGVMSAAGNVNYAVITTDEAEFVVPMGGTYLSGEAFMTAATSDGTELAAALAVGEAGDPNERPMDVTTEALTTLAASGQPNEDFLREDALLVVVLVTDEEDDLEQVTQWGSDGDPADWISAITAVKSYRRNVVPLSIIPTGTSCDEDADAPRLAEFTNAFPRGATYDVCDAEYATFLVGQVGSINQACDLFLPP